MSCDMSKVGGTRKRTSWFSSRPFTASRAAGGVGRTRRARSASPNRSVASPSFSLFCRVRKREGSRRGGRQSRDGRILMGFIFSLRSVRGGRQEDNDRPRCLGRSGARAIAAGDPVTYHVEPYRRAIVVHAGNGARCPLASVMPFSGIDAALAPHLDTRARPEVGDSRDAAARNLVRVLILALPRDILRSTGRASGW